MLPALDSQFCFLYCKTEKEIFILQDGGGGLWSCLTGVPTPHTQGFPGVRLHGDALHCHISSWYLALLLYWKS